MSKTPQSALEQIGDLAERWISTRHKTREEITRSIIENFRFITNHGSKEDIKELVEYCESLEEKLRSKIADHLRIAREKVSPQMIH